MIYRESESKSKEHKINYLHAVQKVILKRQAKHALLRKNFCQDIFTNQEKYRNELKNMLGWPLNDCALRDVPHAKLEKLSEEQGMDVFRVSIEVLEDLNITGLFFKKHTKKCPLILAQHGKKGTPEHMSGLYGNTTNYNNLVPSLFEYDVNVFAPQLLLWDEKKYDLDYDRYNLDMQLKSVGSSIAALEIFAYIRIMDYFEKQDFVSTFGMIGLSYGGFYTMYTTAMDTRIQAAISCSFFNDRCKYAWNDLIWQNSVQKFTDSEIVSLIYPRNVWIKVGNQDAAFDVNSAVAEEKRLREMCTTVGTDWYDFELFAGRHEYYWNPDTLDRFIEILRQ
ncbi:MAG: hypothetical protein PUB07_06555 [Clostridia bacterium]|nr:hypothetical protein [Clostridia bacterium]